MTDVERRRGTDDRSQVLVSVPRQGRRVRGLAQDERLAESLLSDAVPDLAPMCADLLARVRHLSQWRRDPGVTSGS